MEESVNPIIGRVEHGGKAFFVRVGHVFGEAFDDFIVRVAFLVTDADAFDELRHNGFVEFLAVRPRGKRFMDGTEPGIRILAFAEFAAHVAGPFLETVGGVIDVFLDVDAAEFQRRKEEVWVEDEICAHLPLGFFELFTEFFLVRLAFVEDVNDFREFLFFRCRLFDAEFFEDACDCRVCIFVRAFKNFVFLWFLLLLLLGVLLAFAYASVSPSIRGLYPCLMIFRYFSRVVGGSSRAVASTHFLCASVMLAAAFRSSGRLRYWNASVIVDFLSYHGENFGEVRALVCDAEVKGGGVFFGAAHTVDDVGDVV